MMFVLSQLSQGQYMQLQKQRASRETTCALFLYKRRFHHHHHQQKPLIDNCWTEKNRKEIFTYYTTLAR